MILEGKDPLMLEKMKYHEYLKSKERGKIRELEDFLETKGIKVSVPWDMENVIPIKCPEEFSRVLTEYQWVDLGLFNLWLDILYAEEGGPWWVPNPAQAIAAQVAFMTREIKSEFFYPSPSNSFDVDGKYVLYDRGEKTLFIYLGLNDK